MTRVACLMVPLFPLAARLRSEPELNDRAVAICDGNGSTARIVAASRTARQAGIRPRMTLAQARGVLPNLIARGRDASCEQAAHEALLEVAWSLSPRVEDAGRDPHCLAYADVSGMDRLFPGDSGELHMGQAAMVTARHLSLPLRIGIAANKLAARVAAHQPGSPTVIPAGDEAAFLAPLPLSRLQLARRMAETLERWGVTTMGELARLPADQVASRLGLDGSRAHQAAQGLDAEPLVPHHPPAALGEGMELEWPVVTVEPLLFAVHQALERIAGRLEPYGLACTLLELELRLEPEGVERRTIHLPSPTRDINALLCLVRLEIESRPPSAPVAAFTCLAHPDQPRRGQLTLFGPAELDPDRLATTLARLSARLGTEQVGSPRTVDGHLPERFACPAFDPPPAPRVRRPPRRGRGLLAVRALRPPVELEVITETRSEAGQTRTFPRPCDDPPAPSNPANPSASSTTLPDPIRLVSITSPPGATLRIQGKVRIAAGPWNLQTGWWTDDPVERDYWDVELSTGGLYRIFRDRTSNDWFADGVYD